MLTPSLPQYDLRHDHQFSRSWRLANSASRNQAARYTDGLYILLVADKLGEGVGTRTSVICGE